MKKENKQMAQRKRAEQRRIEARNKRIRRCLQIGIPILVIVLLFVFLVLREQGETSSETESATTAATEAASDTETAQVTLNTDTSLTVEDGDTVNIDYVGTVDGVEFDGGSTEGYGTDLTIGSGTYIDDFEEQLIGANVGDTVEVVVTFPDDYGVDELNGQEAVFTTTINGIYE